MSDPPPSTDAPAPIPYRVVYSGRVRNELRNLLVRAKNLGLGQEVFAAIKEIDRRLHLYPQFGQPLCDLKLIPAQIWIGTVPPLVVHYVLDEEHRTVTVVQPLTPLPRSGL